jgi:hypothetical protein
VADLGATVVYLGPIARRSAIPKASPYSIADYNQVDPECGTALDLHEFVEAAHSRIWAAFWRADTCILTPDGGGARFNPDSMKGFNAGLKPEPPVLRPLRRGGLRSG